MQPVPAAGTEALTRIAARNGFSVDATQSMLDALVRGGGRMAQFNHGEFSGPGQWMRGGMTMVSDMFNNDLKARVDALASDLSTLLDERPLDVTRPSGVVRPPVAASPSGSTLDIPATLERLADLKAKGVLSAEEFNAKKAELLARI